MSLLLTFLAGSVFFPFTLYLFYTLFKYMCEKNNTAFSNAVSAVSALQAVFSCAVGYTVASSCIDIMSDRHYLTDRYAVFAFPYFYYDIIAMYTAHILNNTHLQTRKLYKQVTDFFLSNKFMCVHHIAMPPALLVIILIYRRGLGDYFVGVFYLMELPIPCLSLHRIMLRLDLKDTALYPVVGITMTVLFGLGRVAVFPYLYWTYSHYKGISFIKVPSAIPLKCNLGCFALLLPQLYWFLYMLYKLYMFFSFRKIKS